MLEILHFVFRDFWTWLGTVILIQSITAPFANWFRVVVKATRGEKNAKS